MNNVIICPFSLLCSFLKNLVIKSHSFPSILDYRFTVLGGIDPCTGQVVIIIFSSFSFISVYLHQAISPPLP